jgi:hypothetical protein
MAFNQLLPRESLLLSMEQPAGIKRSMTFFGAIRQELKAHPNATLGERFTFFIALPFWWLDETIGHKCDEFFFEDGTEMVCKLEPNHQGKHARCR